MRIAVLAVLLLVGCTKPNPNYCVGSDCPDQPPMACTASSGTCVCLDKVCVECTADDERNCGGTTPQCGADNRCRACRANSDCDSGACLEDGACAAADSVITASPTGVNSPGCGVPGQPDCSIKQAVAELGARDVIRLVQGTYSADGIDGIDFGAKSGTLVARGALIVQSGTGPILSVRNGQSLKLVGGTVSGPNGTVGVRCNTGGKLQIHEAIIEKMPQSGLETDSCDFTVSRSIIRSNLRGGISMVNTSRVATITNNYVYRNGQGTQSIVGGMLLKLAPGSKLEFNTVVDNQCDIGTTSGGGIICDISSGNYDAPYNLVYRNQGGLGGIVQVIGTCTFMGSYQQAAASIDENAVMFERPNDPANPSYRLTAASPTEVRDHAVTGYSCKDLIDFDGDARPQPSGGVCDMGADEFRAGQ